jgi:hypothetical protein
MPPIFPPARLERRFALRVDATDVGAERAVARAHDAVACAAPAVAAPHATRDETRRSGRAWTALALGRAAIVVGAVMPAGRVVDAAPPTKIEVYALDNGLTVVLRRTASAPDGAVAVLYRVGAGQDPPERAGLARVVDELYLGAKTAKAPARAPDTIRMSVPRGSFHGLGYEHGVQDDHSYFVRVLPSKDVPQELEDAAARMAGVLPTPEEVDAAKAIATRSIADAAGARPSVASVELSRAAIVEPERSLRRVGLAAGVAAVTPEEVVARLAAAYHPKNAILSITGDVDVGAIRALVKRWFGPIPAGAPVPDPAAAPPIPQPAEFAAAGAGPVILERTVEANVVGGLATLALAAPPMSASSEYAAFLVVATRLYDAQFTAGASPAATLRFDPWKDPRCLQLERRVGAGSSGADAAQALEEALAGAAKAPVTAKDGVRVRTSLNTWFGVAPIEGSFADDPRTVAYGDGRRVQLGVDGDAILKRVASVKASDVVAATRAVHRVVVVVPAP